MSLTLSPEEVARLTHRDRPKAQARVLDRLGIPYRPHPFDPVLVVSRAAAEAALGGKLEEAVAQQPTAWEVDVTAIRRHGKAQASH